MRVRIAQAWLSTHWTRIAAVALVLAGALYILLPSASPSEADAYRFDNDEKEGTSQFFAALPDIGYESKTLFTSPVALSTADATSTLYLAIGLEHPYSDQELDALEAFAAKGGNVMVADNTESITSLAIRYGVSAAIERLWDLDLLGSNVTLVGAQAMLGTKTFEFLMDKPALFTLAQNREYTLVQLAKTHQSVIDLNQNGVADLGDEKGTRPVVVEITHPDWSGRMFLVSDPHLFIDAFFVSNQRLQIEISDLPNAPILMNHELALALVRNALPGGGTVLFDESKHYQPASVRIPGRTLSFFEYATATPGNLLPFVPTAAVEVLVLLGIVALAFRGVKISASWAHRFQFAKRPLPAAVELHGDEPVRDLLDRFFQNTQGHTIEELMLADPERARDLLPAGVHFGLHGEIPSSARAEILAFLESKLTRPRQETSAKPKSPATPATAAKTA